MKTFILLFLVSLPVFASECKLTGKMESTQELQTTLGAQSFEDCRLLGSTALGQNFFGLVTKEDKILSTKVVFRDENGVQSEVLEIGPGEF